MSEHMHIVEGELLEMNPSRRDVFTWSTGGGYTSSVDLNRVAYAVFGADDTLSLYLSWEHDSLAIDIPPHAAMECWKRYIGESS